MEGMYKKFRDNFIHNSATMSVFSLRLRTRQGYPLLCYFYSIFTVDSSLLARARKQEKRGGEASRSKRKSKMSLSAYTLYLHYISHLRPLHSISQPVRVQLSLFCRLGSGMEWKLFSPKGILQTHCLCTRHIQPQPTVTTEAGYHFRR